MLLKASIGLGLLSGLLGWLLWGALEDKGRLAAQLEVASTANQGLLESRLKCEARYAQLTADLKTRTQERNDAIRVAQENESAADTELARLRNNAREVARNDPESCLHTTLPDGLFDGLPAESR